MADHLLLESGSLLLLEDSTSLLLESSPADWSAWKYSRALTDSNSTTLANFVVVVPLTATNFNFSLAKSDGSDLRVYDSTAGVVLPLWLLDYDPVGQTATLFYKAVNTSHAHTLYYGNPSAPAVLNFGAVFTHGSGFDADWGDLATSVAGATGAAIRYPGPASPSDPRNYTFWRLQESPMLSISDGVPTAGGAYTGVREINLIRDGATNRVLKIGGLYYVTFTRRPNVNTLTIDNWIASSTSKTGPWSNYAQMWATGTEHLNYGSSPIKVGSTYYTFVTFGWANGGAATPGLVVRLRISTDLVTWTDQGTVLAPGVFNDQVSGPCTDIGNPWVMQCSDGVYMMVVEGYGSSGQWACYGATSPGPPFLAWTPLNSGNPLIGEGAAGTWDFNGAANPKCFQMPDNTYMMMFNGSDIAAANLDWQIGFAYAASRAGPYTMLAANPVAGHTTGTYGCETAHLSWDEDGTNYFNIVQRFDTTSATAHAFFLYPEKLQGGLLLGRAVDNTDAAVAGCMLAAGSFRAETRSVFLAHRTVNSSLFAIALANSATVPAPMTAGSFLGLRRLEITRASHDQANSGDLGLVYWDTGAVRHFWTGSVWQTAGTTIATDYAREIVASIAYDAGLNIYYLTATYADDGSVIASATISGASVGSFGAGRALLTGDPYTDASIATTYYRYVMVRPYAAVEPAMVTGPLAGGATVPLSLFSGLVA
jgi:hypothetical protein